VAYRSLRKDSAPGIDYQSWEDYGKSLDENVKSLLDRAKSGRYQAPAVRGVEIPKPGSQEKRPLGIPTIEDKVLQKGVLMVLEPIYELEFYPFSFGFRKGKSPHQALEYLWQGIMSENIQWIIDHDNGHTEILRHGKAQRIAAVAMQEGMRWSDSTANR